MYDYLGRANNRGSSGNGSGGMTPANVQGNNSVSVNTPQTVSTTPVQPDPVMTIQPGPYNPYSGMNTGSINAFYGNPNNIGMGDITTAFKFGYTTNDVAQAMASGQYKVGNPAQAAINASKQGVTSMFYSPQFVNWQDPNQVAKGQSQFGHADLDGNLAAGYSYTDILSFLDSNPSKLNPTRSLVFKVVFMRLSKQVLKVRRYLRCQKWKHLKP